MGISMGQIMRNLAHEMRHRRRSQAEERAQKTPILMLFPLVFLIFPAMFIILMTPAVINLIHNLKVFREPTSAARARHWRRIGVRLCPSDRSE